jgi:hypothetical protein
MIIFVYYLLQTTQHHTISKQKKKIEKLMILVLRNWQTHLEIASQAATKDSRKLSTIIFQ